MQDIQEDSVVPREIDPRVRAAAEQLLWETRDDGSPGSPEMHRVEMMRDDFKRWSEAVLAMRN